MYYFYFLTISYIFFILRKLYKYFYNIYLLNETIDNYDETIVILTSEECKCKKYYSLVPYLKCKKCLSNHVINFENINEVFSTFSKINSDKKCHLIIDTLGGECSYADTFSRLLIENQIDVKVYIPRYAKSAGTMIAISGNEIFMNWYSIMGPIDTQIDYDEEDTFSAKYIKEFKKKNWAKDKEFIRGLEAESYHSDDTFLLNRILKDNDNKERIVKRLLNTKHSHEMSYIRQDVRNMGLPIRDNIPEFVNKIFTIYQGIFD